MATLAVLYCNSLNKSTQKSSKLKQYELISKLLGPIFSAVQPTLSFFIKPSLPVNIQHILTQGLQFLTQVLS